MALTKRSCPFGVLAISLTLCCTHVVAGRLYLDKSSSEARDTLEKISSEARDNSENDATGLIRPTHNCNGMGTRYCGDAHKATECPRGCRHNECRKSDSEGGLASEMRDIVMAGAYDFVYVEERSKKVCAAHCQALKFMTCQRGASSSARFLDEDGNSRNGNYCQMIDCSKDGGKIAGCHDTEDFVRPTCDMCRRLFPEACS